MYRYIYFITIFFIGFVANTIAQPFPVLNFKSITEKDGLSSNDVNNICQDRNGIIWIATANGLNRYDGKRLKSIYANSKDSACLYSNHCSYIRNTSGEALWVTGSTSVQLLDPRTEKFRNIGNNFTMPSLVENSLGSFILDQAGVYRYLKSGNIEKLNSLLTPFEIWGKKFFAYEMIYADRKNNYWGHVQNRIFRVDPVTKKALKEFVLDPTIDIQDLYFDHQNRCWLATWGRGIFLFDTVTGKIEQFQTGSTKFVALSFNSWNYKGRNYIAACTDGLFGLILIDEETLSYKTYLSGSGTLVRSAYTDRDNNLWVSTTAGVKIAAAAPLLFEIISIGTPASTGNGKTTIRGVYISKETATNFWLTKRYEGGVFKYAKDWKLLNHWPELINPSTDKYRKISHTKEGYDFMLHANKIYISTESGLVMMDTFSKSSSLIYADNDSMPPRLRNIVDYNDSLWWIRSFRKGVYQFNFRENRFTKLYKLHNADKIELNVNYLIQTSKKDVFASTFEGLYHLNKSNDLFEKLNISNLPSMSIKGIAEDGNGIIWLATENGMAAYDPFSGKITKTFYEYPDMGACERVSIDNFNNVWFNCQQGYWCWVQQKQQMVKFGYNMGLPDNRVEAGFSKGLDGSVYGGASDAIVKFYPESIMQYSVNAKSYISDVFAGSKRIPAININDSTKQIEFGPGLRSLNILFSVTEYNTPGNYSLFYRIIPDKEWTASESGNIGFNNLSHGDYLIEVKGKNNLTGNFSKPYFLELNIKPHWYQTHVFQLFLLLTIAAFTYLLYRKRLNSIRRHAQIKQRIVETEMQLLRSQMNPHFIFNSLNSIENFIMKNEKRLASDYLNKFSRLIRSILESSKNEIVPFEKDMEALKLYVELEQLRFNNKFSYEVSADPELLNGDYKVPSLVIQPYVENAIVHGIGHSEKPGLRLYINVKIFGSQIRYTVEDNGIGRSQAAVYNKENKPQHKSVGLQITEERIQLFNNSSEPPVIFTDLYQNGNAAGTKVEIKLKTI